MIGKKDVDDLEKEFPEEEIDVEHQRGRGRIEKALLEFLENAERDPELLTRRWADIREMILNVDGRVNYWENRRTQFLQLTVALLAAALAGSVAILANVDLTTWAKTEASLRYLPVLASCIALFLGSLRLLLLWNSQNNPNYPFTKAYRVWRWHYRHAEKVPVDTDFSAYDRRQFREQVRRFADNLAEYKIRTLAADPAELIDQDLSQLYVLITNEKFKIMCVSALRDSLLRTCQFAFYVGIAAGFALLLYFLFN